MPKRKDEGPEYWPDNELDKIAHETIESHHPHLLDADIRLLLTSKEMHDKGRTVAGTARSPRGILRYFSQCDFLIIIDGSWWRSADTRKRRAVVDHELCHCSVSHDEEGERIVAIVGHDIEEFTAVVDRHGLYRESLLEFANSCAEQLKLPLGSMKQDDLSGDQPAGGE